jgi:hypothetical protein
MPPATSEELRGQLGRIAVVARSNATWVEFDVPTDKSEIAADLPTVEFIPPKRMAAVLGPVIPPVPGFAQAGAALVLASPFALAIATPVAHELHRAYGLALAESETAVASAQAHLAKATRELAFDEVLRDRVEAELAAHLRGGTVVRDRARADTVLELMVFEPRITGRESVNPELSLHLGLRVRLVEARTGRELYYDYLQYRGGQHRFVRWGAEDRRVFADEIEQCLVRLAREVGRQLDGAPATPSALALLGITHRATASGPVAPNRMPVRAMTAYAASR